MTALLPSWHKLPTLPTLPPLPLPPVCQKLPVLFLLLYQAEARISKTPPWGPK